MYVFVHPIMKFAVIDSCVQGHHISKDFWMPRIGEELSCQHEENNPSDFTQWLCRIMLVLQQPAHYFCVKAAQLCAKSQVAGERQWTYLLQGGIEVLVS